MKAVIQSLALAFVFFYIAASAQPNQIQYGGQPNTQAAPQFNSQGPVSTGPASVTGEPGNPQSVTGGGSFFGENSNAVLSPGNTGNSRSNAVASGSPQAKPSPYQPLVPVVSPDKP